MKRSEKRMGLPSDGNFPASRSNDPHVIAVKVPGAQATAITGPKKIVNKAQLYFG